MAGEALAVVTLHAETGLPADDWVNNWAIQGLAAGAETAAVAVALTNFYEAIDGFFAHTVDTDQFGEVDFYNLVGHLDGSPHGSPYDHEDLAWAAGVGADSMPAEVAVCLTLEGTGRAAAAVEVGATRPKQRRTGRVYLGPLSTSIGEEVGGRFQVSATAIDTILDAAEALVADITTAGASLAVWSRADAAMYPIEAVSMDNAFDTIRKRGWAPTTRTRRSV